MTRKSKTDNINLKMLIRDLKRLSKEKKVKIWAAVAKNLEKPSRIRRAVNIAKINKYSKDNDVIIVPGKVLGQGELDHKVIIAAFQFSESAKEKCKCISIIELMEKNPSGKNIKIIG